MMGWVWSNSEALACAQYFFEYRPANRVAGACIFLPFSFMAFAVLE